MRSSRLFLAALVCLGACLSAAADEPVLESDQDKMLYTLGFAVSQNLAQFEFTEEEMAKIQSGVSDGALRRDARVPIEDFGPRIDAMLQERMKGIAEREKAEGATFLAELGKMEGAVTTESGLVYREIEPGTGTSPKPTDKVRLHYHGTLRDGKVFDSSVERDTPAEFTLNGVIPCFSEGLQKMKVGGTSKLGCPSNIAYGDRGSPPKIRPGAALVFEVQLLEILTEPEPATPAP